MPRPVSVGLAGVAVAGIAAGIAHGAPGGPRRAEAGTVVGRLELPAAPERGSIAAKGFLDRVENPLAEIKKPSLAPYLVVVLDGEGRDSRPLPDVVWDLVGESFARPVIAAPVGAQVVIRNLTKASRTIGAAEDAKLIVGPLNPTGSKSFRAQAPATYTISDKDAPYLRGKIVVVGSSHVATLDDAGRFEMTNVPDGSYKLRVFYYDPAAEARGGTSDWLPFTLDVTVGARGKAGKTEVNAKLPAIEPSTGRPAGKK
jgi:hypothetical protein